MAKTPSTLKRAPLSLKLICLLAVYLGSGTLQPLAVDELRYHNALGPVYLLLPTLASTLGMAAVGLLVPRDDIRSVLARLRRSGGVASPTTGWSLRRVVLSGAVIDLAAGVLLTVGLEIVGGSVFSVLYASTTAWTALLAKVFLKRDIGAVRGLGVASVTVGLVLNAIGVAESVELQNRAQLLGGSALVIAGSALHSAMFVYTERFIRYERVMPALAWSAALGASEAVVLLLWILLSRLVHGPFVGHSTSYRAALAACVLILINAVHSAAFFRIIDQIGAVASALMKGVQTCLVFCVSAVLFCAVDSAQCFSTLKAVSCVLVVGGVVVYGTVRAPAAKMPLTGAADETV